MSLEFVLKESMFYYLGLFSCFEKNHVLIMCNLRHAKSEQNVL